jgi:hypothetical protein
LFNLAGIEIELVDVVILLRHVKFGTVDSGELTHGRDGFLSRGEGSRHESNYSRLQDASMRWCFAIAIARISEQWRGSGFHPNAVYWH